MIAVEGPMHFRWHCPRSWSWDVEAAEEAMGNKPVSSTPPRPLLPFLPPAVCLEFLPWIMNYGIRGNEPFLTQVVFMVVFHKN